MNLNKLIFTENACYKAGRKITVKGIMVHSTGANNPNLKRYVGPNDGLLGENQYGTTGTPIIPAAERSVSTLSSENWQMAPLLLTRLSLGITVDGTPAEAPIILTSALKSARTVLRITPISRRCTVRPLNFVPSSAKSMA